MIPWAEEDFEIWRRPKWCVVCGRPISPDDDFWRFMENHYHANCKPREIPDATLDWRDWHG